MSLAWCLSWRRWALEGNCRGMGDLPLACPWSATSDTKKVAGGSFSEGELGSFRRPGKLPSKLWILFYRGEVAGGKTHQETWPGLAGLRTLAPMARRMCFGYVLFGALALFSAREASAAPTAAPRIVAPAARAARAPRVVWTEISLPSRESRPDLERFLKHLIDQQTRLANWGARRPDPIEARLEVTELTATVSKDVVRVNCTGVGHLKGGQSVRSHFRWAVARLAKRSSNASF